MIIFKAKIGSAWLIFITPASDYFDSLRGSEEEIARDFFRGANDRRYKLDQASGLRKIVDSEASRMKTQISADKTGKNMGQRPRVISITSGKGGVGKTNITANLAMAFSKLGKKVLILDADLGLANIDIIFGLHPAYNLGNVLSGERQLADVIVDGPCGIRIIPGGSGLTNLVHLTRGQKLSLLSEFDALEDKVDYFLIDTGAGISSNVLYFNLSADECVIVATPEPTSITDAYAMMKVMSTQHGATSFKLLMNMVKDANEAKSVYLKLTEVADKFLNDVFIEYLGYIPADELVKQSVLKRKTFMELYPGAASSQKIKQIARLISDTPRRYDNDGNIKFFFRRLMEYSG